jgi:hypothetical protein
MGERISPAYQRSVIVALLGASLVLGAVLLLAVESVLLQLALAAAGLFALRRLWSATRRKRELARLGFFAGRRLDNHWLYEELRDGEVMAIEFPLAYVGRGEHEILIPGEQSWAGRVPAWARERRTEIIDRLGTVFKRSDMRTDD